jgi:tetratricopeptide (TPR) repeat protein
VTQNSSDLGGMIQDAPAGEASERVKVATGMIVDFLNQSDLMQDPIISQVMEGQSPAQAMGLTRDDLEVLYAVGFNQLNAGEFNKAADTFTNLCLIDPLEAKNHYCLGMAYQLRGEPRNAAPIFINFLSLDATNPHGYLRYGECLMAQGEKTEALESFRLALIEAEKNNSDPGAASEARSKIALAEKDT